MSAFADAEDDLAYACLEHVRKLPFVRSATLHRRARGFRDRDVDGVLTVKTQAGATALPLEIKRRHLSREVAQHLVHIGRLNPGLVVFAPLVGREIGDLFEHHGVNFVDGAGNCSFRIDARYVARIQGRVPPQRARVDRALRAPAYRVLFALLARPALVDAPSRTIAADAEVAPQTANDLRARLLHRGLILETSKRRLWAPNGRKEALGLWLAGFTTTLAPNLLIGRFRAMESDPAQLETRVEPLLNSTCEWRYGGGAAAIRLTGHYRGDRTVVYVRAPPPNLPALLRFAPDQLGPIQLAYAPARAAFESPVERVVHPLLAYADLLTEGDERAREAAGEIHEQFLANADATR